MRFAACNTGSDFHLLDHIAPLAALLDCPLLVTEELNYTLARRYYPQVDVQYRPKLDLELGQLAEEFDALVECKYWVAQLKALFRDLYGKEMRLLFCPHGQSDKGFQTPLLTPYAWQDGILLYGDLQIHMLKELGIWPELSSYAIVGNYRLQFYHQHRVFYDKIGQDIGLDPSKKTLLYAPTWRDEDQATSFFAYGTQVISELPADWNLIVKVHPMLEQRDPALFYSIAAQVDRHPNAFLLHEFPPVYPVLALADIYLGDASSVGYDFLLWDRPLYFLPAPYSGRLQTCGRMIDLTRDLYLQLDQPDLYSQARKNLYQLAFGEPLAKGTVQERICALVSAHGRQDV